MIDMKKLATGDSMVHAHLLFHSERILWIDSRDERVGLGESYDMAYHRHNIRFYSDYHHSCAVGVQLLFEGQRPKAVLKIDSHPLHVVGEDGYRYIVMYFTLPARNSKSSRYLS